jgi:acetyltransferase-like isoleucine patch superfamily enzyme
VKHATGQFIIFVNAGDLLHPRHLTRAANAIGDADSRRCFLFCDVQKFHANGRPGAFITGRTPNASRLGLGVGFAHPGSVVSRGAFDEVDGFSIDLKIAIDTDFILRCLKAGYEFRKFASIAYMGMGGVSDRKFGLAMKEYRQVLAAQGFATASSSGWRPVFLAGARKALHVYRAVARPVLRWLKHLAVAIANLIADLMIVSPAKRLYLRLLGMKIEKGASIGFGTHFYIAGNITVGPNTVINRNCLLDNRETIVIGANVSIARSVAVFTAGHDVQSPMFDTVRRSVRIEDRAVIFSHAMICPGVTVGHGAVVYPGAVVTRDVPDNHIVGGNPAVSIGMRKENAIYELDYPYPLAM